MSKLITVIILILCFGCLEQSENVNSKKITPDKVEIKSETDKKLSKSQKTITSLEELKLENDLTKSYKSVKNAIEKQRAKLNSDNIIIDTIGQIFKTSLLNRIIPYWEETKWSFEGHTSKPKTGKIACGYFVSTTLQDVGIKLNRYKLAQQSPINEAKSLAINSNVIKIEQGSTKQNIIAINKNLEDGIHFIGFDASHVGYILKERGELYLIHSNYENAKGVEIEKIEESKVFSSYERFYLVELSTNENLLANWIKGESIEIINE